MAAADERSATLPLALSDVETPRLRLLQHACAQKAVL